MRTTKTIDLAPHSARDDSEAVRVLGTTLGLLFSRYGLPPAVGYRCVDGSFVWSKAFDLVEEYRIGALFETTEARGGQSAVAVEATIQTSPGVQVPLTFTAVCRGHTIEIGLDASDLLERAGIDASMLMGHIAVLMREAVDRPEQQFGALDILSERERRLLLEDFNGNQATYPAVTLHGMFVAQARRTPDAIAVVEGDCAMTYGELDTVSNRVGHQLRPYVSEPGQIIAVNGDRSIATLIVKIGVMKAGAAFLYLAPDTPINRIALICKIAAPVAVIRSRDTPAFESSGIQLWLEDLLLNDTANEHELEEIADESTTAYILFTSGSTGEPKGVVRSHRMNTTRIFLEQKLYQLGARDRHLMKSVPFFREFFWALATGGTVVVARSGGERDDAYLIWLIRRQGITVCSFVPSMLRVLTANPSWHEPNLPIQHLFVAGEALDEELERRLRNRGLEVHVTYTLAEADYVCHRGGPPAMSNGSIDVGRPIDMRLYVCDSCGRLMPPGFVGELLAGGPGLSDGYVNRRDLTAERFIKNPFDPERVRILFRTGDLGRYRADGQVEFIGRVDNQVKIRGQRVEPTEIEHVIRRHDAVENVVVVGLPNPNQGHLLAAYVSVKSGQLNAQALRRYLSENLPDYMVPSYLVQVAHMPLLPSGKVDRASLTTVLTSRRPDLGYRSKPEDDLQRRIAATWSKVLGIDEIGIDDPFLDLGGDSLRAMLLRVALEIDLGVTVDLAALIQFSTVRQLADHLRDDPCEQ